MNANKTWVARPRKRHNFTGLRDCIQRATPRSSVTCIGQMYDNGLEFHVTPGAQTHSEAEEIKRAAFDAGYDAVWFNNSTGTTVVQAWKRKSHRMLFGFIILLSVLYYLFDVHKIHSSRSGMPWVSEIWRYIGFHV